MAFEKTGPGSLEAGPKFVGRLLLALGVLVALVAAGLGSVARSSGWQDDYWGAVLFVVALGGLGGWVAWSQRRLRVTPYGVQVLRFGRAPGEPRGRARRVRMRVETRTQSSGNSSRSVLVHVGELLLDGEGLPESFVLQEAQREAPVRRACEDVARHLGVPLEDAIGDDPEVREVDELDRGFRKAGEPAGAPPAGVSLLWDEVGPGVEISGLVPAAQRAAVWAVLAAVPLSGLVGLAVVFGVLDDPALAAFVAVPVLLGDAAIVVWALARLRARERIRVAPDGVRRDLFFAGRAWRAVVVPRSSLERLRIQTGNDLARGLALVSDARSLVVGRALDEPGLRWLRTWLEAQL